jgi:hypothetical protein
MPHVILLCSGMLCIYIYSTQQDKCTTDRNVSLSDFRIADGRQTFVRTTSWWQFQFDMQIGARAWWRHSPCYSEECLEASSQTSTQGLQVALTLADGCVAGSKWRGSFVVYSVYSCGNCCLHAVLQARGNMQTATAVQTLQCHTSYTDRCYVNRPRCLNTGLVRKMYKEIITINWKLK